MVIRRGEIWWASLGKPRGSGPGYRRPVVVVQSNAFNRSSIGTVMVAAITSNLHNADAPGNVRLSPGRSKLAKPCVVNVSQILTIDKGLLTERVSRLPDRLLSQVDAGLRLALSLPHAG
jgi:mRNA interferase MazF